MSYPQAMPAAPVNPELLPDHPQASGAQTLGIIALVLSLVGFGIVAPFALYRAMGVRKEIAARPGVYRPGGPAKTAWLTSLIATIIFAVGTLFIAIAIFSVAANS